MRSGAYAPARGSNQTRPAHWPSAVRIRLSIIVPSPLRFTASCTRSGSFVSSC